MAKLGGKYETIFVIDATLTDEAIAGLVERYKTLVEQNATLGEVNEWGKRRLAYPINDLTEGHYVLMTFTATPDLPAELDRVFKITEGIMRSMIICKDE
jgi:small subunit ribosomal protein S6